MFLEKLKSAALKIKGSRKLLIGCALAVLTVYFLFISLSLQRYLPLPYYVDTLIFGILPAYTAVLLAAIGVILIYLQLVKRNVQGLENLSVIDLLLWATAFGLLGGRLVHILEFLNFYLQNPGQIFGVAVGSINILGSMGFIALGVYIYSRRSKIDFSLLSRYLILIWPVVFAIGRLGNYFSRQLYGLPTDLPWAMFVDAQFRYPGFETVEFYHPVFLYEQILNLFLFVVLLRLYRRKKSTMLMAKVYVVGYMVGRFLIDFLRLEPKYLFDLSFTQVLILALFALAILFGWIWQISYRLRKGVWWQR